MSVLEWSVAVSNGVTAAGWRYEGSWQNQWPGADTDLSPAVCPEMSQTQGCLFSSAHIELQPHCRMLLHSDRNKPETKKKKKNQTLLQKEGNNDPKTFKFSPLHFIQNVGTCNFYTLAGHAAPVLAEETDAFMLELCFEGNLHRNLWGNWKPLSAFFLNGNTNFSCQFLLI